ncbi:Hydroxyethylthiazole kinase family-domain-containing protein [Syncephalastrum racemosum]|uniref:Hydroxyethylthiazole kinase family-domain-containing protein n=1 Tax=Syncephalastrum racemosum TaxID=13706 RepID=A0A1X2HU82_SYNRA|nr:Hydroxyethylthiazole kinase family-domain-containing protein [Syncephalastrum racemosum]
MAYKQIDYSLYLVTDNTLVPPNATFLGQVEKALEGGVTIVQLREKEADTGDFITLARQVKQLTEQFGVPLIINDRLDVAQAVDAEGVHVGQDDMPLATARQILGHTKIIGVSVNTIEEARAAIEGGADYLGIGAVWDTSTKKLTKKTLGIDGVKDILGSMSPSIPTVAIGGVKLENSKELLTGSKTESGVALSGLAIVSAIMAAADPTDICKKLCSVIRESLALPDPAQTKVNYAVQFAREATKAVGIVGPMVHHITNYVVINDNANATLAVGASPIMSTNKQELEDLAAVNGAMVLNMGTLSDPDIMIAAAHVNLRHGNPVVLDPVGGGATAFRRRMVARFLNECQLTVLKGNSGEILSIAGRGGRSRGVDSVGDNGGESNAALAVKELAIKYKCVVAMTGPIDYVSDGEQVLAIENGDPLLAAITGSGCMVTSIVGCYTAANRHDYFHATVAAILAVTVASELATERPDVRGPGTFRAALIDGLYQVAQDPSLIIKRARVRSIAI